MKPWEENCFTIFSSLEFYVLVNIKVKNAKTHNNISQQQLIKRIKYSNVCAIKGNLYLLEFKGGDCCKKIKNTAAWILCTIANVVSKGSKIVKNFTESEIEQVAFIYVFYKKQVQDFLLTPVKNKIYFKNFHWKPKWQQNLKTLLLSLFIYRI